jgi:hypothetical protein
VLCVTEVKADYFTYVQLSVQSVPVDKLSSTKHIKRPPFVNVKQPTCVIRKTATLFYT